MASFDYNPIASYVTITWNCPNCRKQNITQIVPPQPDFSAETDHDSQSQDDFDVECQHCNHQINVTMCTGMWSSWGEIDVDDEDLIGVDDFIEPDDDYYDSVKIEDSHNDTLEILDAIEDLSPEHQKKLRMLLYANVITKMETFLCDTLKQYVMSDKEHKKRFVSTYKDFNDMNLKYSQIYEKYDSLDNVIKNKLNDILYHNIPKVNNVYKKVIGIDIKPDDIVFKAIDKRHDIVHRNGKDKEGNLLNISKDEVKELSEYMVDYINGIEEKIRQVRQEENMVDYIDENKELFKDEQPF